MSVRWVRQILTVALFAAAALLFLLDVLGSTPAPGGQSQASVVAPSEPRYPIIRAARPLARGSIIRPEDVELAVSSVSPEKGAVTRLDDASERVALQDIAAAEPLSDSNTADARRNGLSNIIPPGMRAIALQVTDESAVANFIKPGDRVDLLVVSNAARSAPADGRSFPMAEAVTVLQNVAVLAVGAQSVGDEGNKSSSAMRNVTLAVTPEQAAVVALVHSVGTEYLTLRSTSDEIQIPSPVASTNDLQPSRPAETRPVARAVPRRPRARVVEVIAGKSSNVSRVSVADDK